MVEKLKKTFGKLLSRKLLVFIVACTFLPLGFIDMWVWFSVGAAYMGVEGIADIVARLKSK